MDIGPASAPPLLQLHGLSLRGPLQQSVIDGLSLQVAAGEIVALIGESGSGKTMAARSILRLLPPQIQVSAGAVLFEGRDLYALTDTNMRRLRGTAIGMVFQDPTMSLNPAMRVGAQLVEGLRQSTAMSQRECLFVAAEMLERVHVPNPVACMQQFPHQFSEGARQRIMLASAMLGKPRLLIADEPTSSLDSLTQHEVMQTLVSVTKAAGSGVLLITHDLGLVARYADNVVVVHKGQSVEAGPTASVLQTPRGSYTRALIAALPGLRKARKAVPASPPLIEATDVQVAFRARTWPAQSIPVLAVDRVSLSLRPGETVAIVGGSGAGKTTLARALADLQPLSGGSIRFRGMTLPGSNTLQRQFRIACQFIFQDPYSSLDPRHRVSEIVSEPLRHDASSKGRRRTSVLEMLDSVGLLRLQMRFPHELSAGQRQRVAIARALVRNPELVIADEPFSTLDMMTQRQLIELLKVLQERHGFACVFITHSLATASELADRVMVMHHGRIVEQGSVDAVFDAPQDPYTRRLLNASNPRNAVLCVLAHQHQSSMGRTLQRGQTRGSTTHTTATEGP